MKLLNDTSLNKFFVDLHQIPTLSFRFPELLAYHIKLYGFEEEYIKFVEYTEKNENLLHEKNEFLFNSIKSVILNTRFQVFNMINSKDLRIDNDELFYWLKKFEPKYNTLTEFWKVIADVFKDSDWKEKTEAHIETFGTGRVSDKVNSIRNFITNQTDFREKLKDSRIHNFIIYNVNMRRTDEKAVLNREHHSMKTLYSKRFKDRWFMSVDLKKANYQALRQLCIIEDINFEDFVTKYTDVEYIKSNKPLRQILYGILSKARVASFFKLMLLEIYHALMDKVEVNYDDAEIFVHSGDEILIVLSDNEIDRKEEIQTIEGSIEYASKSFGSEIKVNTEVFIFRVLDSDVGEMYYKEYKDGTKQIKGTPVKVYPQVYKHLYGIELTDKDLYFEDTDMKLLGKYIKPINLK